MHEKHKHAVNDSSQEFSNESVSKVQNLNIKQIQIVPVVHDCIIHGTWQLTEKGDYMALGIKLIITMSACILLFKITSDCFK